MASRIDLDRLLAGDAVRAPGFVAQRLSLSHAGDVAGSVEIAGIQRGLPSTANFERHRYRLADGALLGERSSAQRGFWLRAFIAVQPLHFAQYQWLGPGWSAALRGLHLAMGLGACLLCASGLYLWLQRRASAPDARVRLLQRLSQGFCAGLVAAAALLLLGLQLAPSGYSPDPGRGGCSLSCGPPLAWRRCCCRATGRWRADCSASPGWPAWRPPSRTWRPGSCAAGCRPWAPTSP